jgi:hypothetical protein
VSRELKIVLIVMASIVAIAFIGIFVLVLSLPRIAKALVHTGAEDPAAAKRVLAKIATVEIPRGFRIGTASDLGVTQIVTLVPSSGDGGFQIQLQGSLAPTSADASVEGMKVGMNMMSGLTKCDLKDDGIDEVTVRGVHVKLRVVDCPNSKYPFRMETGIFPGNAMQAQVTAIGVSGENFNTQALHELLTSVR